MTRKTFVTNSLITIAMFSWLMAACTTTTHPVQQPLIAPPIPQATPVVLKDVQWKVYNRDALIELVEQLKKDGNKSIVIFALTPKGYENLSSNMIELERYIKEQKEVTLFLKNTLDGREKAQ